MRESLVIGSAYTSIIIQFVTGIIGVYALIVPRAQASELILKEVLTLEMLVQTVEFLVYTYLLSFHRIHNWTKFRYYDWFFTTPVMLFTTSVYMHYLSIKEHSSSDGLGVIHFLKSNVSDVAVMTIANTLMLAFGYLGEVGRMDKMLACLLGFIFMVVSFAVMHKHAKKTETGIKIYRYMLSAWTLYGIVYLLPSAPKNFAYNFLDVFAKNFFGLYLTYTILKSK